MDFLATSPISGRAPPPHPYQARHDKLILVAKIAFGLFIISGLVFLLGLGKGFPKSVNYSSGALCMTSYLALVGLSQVELREIPVEMGPLPRRESLQFTTEIGSGDGGFGRTLPSFSFIGDPPK